MPMLLPAIHEVLRAVLAIADDVPAALDLPRLNGGKGFGKRLLQIMPSTTPKTLYANAKLYLPNLINAAINDAANVEIAKYHVVSELLRALSTID